MKKEQLRRTIRIYELKSVCFARKKVLRTLQEATRKRRYLGSFTWNKSLE